MTERKTGDSCAAPIELCCSLAQIAEDLIGVKSLSSVKFVAALLQFNAKLISLFQQMERRRYNVGLARIFSAGINTLQKLFNFRR
jgi:hypothetical protein